MTIGQLNAAPHGAGEPAVNVGRWTLAVSTREISWSAERARMYGLADDAAPGTEVTAFLDRVHIDDRSRVSAAIDAAIGSGEATEQTFRIVRPDGAVRHILSCAFCDRDERGRTHSMRGLDIDVTETIAAARASSHVVSGVSEPSAEMLCRLALIALPALIAVLAADGRIVAVNDAWVAFAKENGADEVASVSVGANYLDVVRRASVVGVKEAAEAIAGIEAVLCGSLSRFTMDYACHSPDDTHWYVTDVLPLHDEATGACVGAVISHLDLGERRRAEERQRVLARELAHRGKNLIGVIQAIAQQTIRGAHSLDNANTALTGRLQALARSHGRLTEEAFEGAFLDEILEAELASYGSRATLSGPKVMLRPKVAQTFALVVHELGTNAVKHGALSVPIGRVDVDWRIATTEAGQCLRLTWREAGGPPLTPPTHEGFGSSLLSYVAAADFRCQPELRFEPSGLCYTFDSPIAHIGAVLDPIT